MQKKMLDGETGKVRENSSRWIGVGEDLGASWRVRPKNKAQLLC